MFSVQVSGKPLHMCVIMTQLLLDEQIVVGRHDEDDDTESKEQHLQVAKAGHGAFVEQTEIHQPLASRSKE